jgi:hypothetical protein
MLGTGLPGGLWTRDLIVPKRSNEFQKLVLYIYSMTAGAQAKVTESAILLEDGTGAEREVDILIEYQLAGHALNMAIECRDRSRVDTLGWIDELIGKFERLKVDKIVAVSATGFSADAKVKAQKANIDILTLEEASQVDRASAISTGKYRGMTHRHILFYVGAKDSNNALIAHTESHEVGGSVSSHRDELSEKLFPTLLKFFWDNGKAYAEQKVIEMMSSVWQSFFDDPTPRYFEMTCSQISLDLGGPTPLLIKPWYGLGVRFEFSEAPTTNVVLGKHMLSDIDFSALAGTDTSLAVIQDRDRKIISADLRHNSPLPKHRTKVTRKRQKK